MHDEAKKMTRKNKTPVSTTPKAVTLEDLRIFNYQIGHSQLSSNPNYQLKSYGDWGLAGFRLAVKSHGVFTMNDFIDKFLTDIDPNDFETYAPIKLDEILQQMNVEFEKRVGKTNQFEEADALKTFDGLPSEFSECIRIRFDGNCKFYLALCGMFIYYFEYITS